MKDSRVIHSRKRPTVTTTGRIVLHSPEGAELPALTFSATTTVDRATGKLTTTHRIGGMIVWRH